VVGVEWYGLREGCLFRATSTCWLDIALTAFSQQTDSAVNYHEAVTGPRCDVSKQDGRPFEDALMSWQHRATQQWFRAPQRCESVSVKRTKEVALASSTRGNYMLL
jgi:hypothetical protein